MWFGHGPNRAAYECTLHIYNFCQYPEQIHRHFKKQKHILKMQWDSRSIFHFACEMAFWMCLCWISSDFGYIEEHHEQRPFFSALLQVSMEHKITPIHS